MDCIISMTSWKRRIADIGPVIYSFLALEPICDFRVVLVLSSDEFRGKEKDIPRGILAMTKHPRFEILWTGKNTRAYKKYYPTYRKYPGVPIITVDDDAPAKPNFLKDIWKVHMKDPKRVVYGYNRYPCNRKGIDCVRYGFGMFPPGSLFPLDEEFGMRVFGNMDDEHFRLCHVLAGTKYFNINAYDVLHINLIDQESSLSDEIGARYRELDDIWDRMFREMPELHKLWKKNVAMSNG